MNPSRQRPTTLRRRAFLAFLLAGLAMGLVTGCSDSKLRAELTEHRLKYAEPKLEIVLLKKELVPAEGEYGSQKLRITGIVRQIGDFPVAEYHFYLHFTAKVTATETVELPGITGLIKDKGGAFTADASLYKVTPTVPVAEMVVALKEANWWPLSHWKDTILLKNSP